MQFILGILFICVAFLTPVQGGIKFIAILFFTGAIIAATNDIAIDGYYMEALDKKGQAKFVGYRVMAYRIAMATGTGVIVAIGAKFNWLIAFLGAGAILFFLSLYHLFFLPDVEKEKQPILNIIKASIKFKALLAIFMLVFGVIIIRWIFSLDWYREFLEQLPIIKHISISGWIGIALLIALILLALFKGKINKILLKDESSFYSRAFLTYMDREKIGIILAFIILLRTGEFMLSSMSAAFMVDLGIIVHYSWISGAIGLPSSIIGAMIGGWAISKYSLRKTLWPF
jgi:PAT family beta-lactamase induction signal transducer AmpG